MIKAADTVATFIAGRVRADLDVDTMLLFALVRAIEVIGEAASKVSAETRAAAPGIPWSQIAAMRNRLIHAYFDIDHDILWRTAVDEVPALSGPLRALLDQA
ncbi:MAG: HepT-like ribonuclease domain-containing protein [Acetobacteraceae bacterium]